MRRTLVLAFVFAALRAFAGPIGAEDPHASAATGFPGAYLGSVALSLKADPRYGSRLLDALDQHLQAVGVMNGPQEVTAYLEQSAGGSEGVKSLNDLLGREPLDTIKAAALLLADALARPEQFREVLDGLESAKHGIGRHAAELLRGARGAGDKKLLAALREASKPKRGEAAPPYYSGGRLASLFDAASIAGREGLVLDAPTPPAPMTGSRSRVLDLTRPARP